MKVKQMLVEDKSRNYAIALLDDGKVAYIFDPKVAGKQSASGKSIINSTTSGAVDINLDGLKLSFNSYRKA